MESTGRESVLGNLNDEQRAAVEKTEGPLLIIAGAGTGKTKTLVARTCALIEKGVDPAKILLVTFTNKAAGEMRERIARATDPVSADKVTACTFHSLCANLLRTNAHLLGYEENSFAILSDDDAREIMTMTATSKRKELERRGISAKAFPSAAQILAISENSVSDLISVREAVLRCEKAEGFRDEVEETIAEYDAYKKERNMMDYDDLLANAALILKNFDEVRRRTSRRFEYVMCDEYQDTNGIQDFILDMLVSEHGNLCVVGDDDQSIYRFRGARIENILTFVDRHPGCETVTLTLNYRSSNEILAFCNEVMSRAVEGTRKNLRGTFSGERPKMIVYGGGREQATATVDEIESMHKKGTPYSEMAVMARNSQTTAFVESELQRVGIPYTKFGGQKFFSKEIVRNVFAFLRAAASDLDEIAWYMVLKIYPLIGEERAKKFAGDVARDGADSLTNPAYGRYRHYASMVEARATVGELRKRNLQEQLEYLLEGYYEDVTTRYVEASRMSDDNKSEKLDKLSGDLVEARVLYDLADGYASTREFIDDMTLSFANPEDEGDRLNVTTIHSAKGLEYEAVFLLNPVEGSFPRCKPGDSEDPEELRCLYVALTRAKRRLRVSLAKYGVKYGKPIRNELSHHLAYDDVIELADCVGGVRATFPGSFEIDDFRRNSWRRW